MNGKISTKALRDGMIAMLAEEDSPEPYKPSFHKTIADHVDAKGRLIKRKTFTASGDAWMWAKRRVNKWLRKHRMETRVRLYNYKESLTPVDQTTTTQEG